jgi:signal transduction histidine kinase/ActR/RegA family two-component response regulator
MSSFDARKPFSIEYRLLRHDGEYRWIADSGVPFYGPNGDFTGYIGSAMDITERRHVQEALYEADRRKDEFLATLSHELRNPIAPIRNAVQVLKTIDPAEPRLEWCRNVIDQQIAYMARLMEDLLDVSRITRDKLELRKQIIELREVIRTAVATSGPPIEAAGHKLVVILPPENMPVNADSTRLAQVFVNILNNAAKYMEKGGQIWLGAKVIPAVTSERTFSSLSPETAGDSAPLPPLAARAETLPAIAQVAGKGNGTAKEVIVSIKDTGIGISAALLPRIFDMFTQADASHEHSRGGLGIGLTLARHLINLHGGSIEANSEGVGKGSEFIVRLPLAEPCRELREYRAQAPAPARKSHVLKRILVIDDVHVQATSMAMLLEIMGFEVRIARDGPSALARVQEFLPDAALIDIGLPGMNGYDLARRIRALPQLKGIVLIAQTGWGRDMDRERSREAGFNYHLTKPIDHQLLEKILTRAPDAADSFNKA